jgi:hypothetical protein
MPLHAVEQIVADRKARCIADDGVDATLGT